MALTLLSFATAVQSGAAAAQAASARVLNFTIGSPFRALLEANASLVMWVQYLVLQVMSLIRAATATGADLDSWFADFLFARLPGRAATGSVTFSRFSNSIAALIPVNAPVITADGTQQFLVYADVTNMAYAPALGGYYVAVGVTSVTVPVIAVTASAASNAGAATITLIGTAISGIDAVTNASAFVNGINAENDSAARARFALYIAGLRQATLAAIQAAIAGVQQGLIYSITENYNYSAVYTPGYITIVVDDGSGTPSTQLLSSVTAAVNAVRAASIQFGVFGPVVITANVVMTISTAAGYTHGTIVTQVQTALTTAINALGIGQALSFSRLASIAYGVSPGVNNVTAVTLNAGTADLSATTAQVIRGGTMTVT